MTAAQIAARCGRLEDAFAALSRFAAEDPDVRMLEPLFARVNPFLRPLHSDPRWKAFLRKLNLPVE